MKKFLTNRILAFFGKKRKNERVKMLRGVGADYSPLYFCEFGGFIFQKRSNKIVDTLRRSA